MKLRWQYDEETGDVSLQMLDEDNEWVEVPLVDKDGNIIIIESDGEGEKGRFWGLN